MNGISLFQNGIGGFLGGGSRSELRKVTKMGGPEGRNPRQEISE